MDSPLVIIAHARAKPGLEVQMLAAQVELVKATQASPGCIRYELNVSNSCPGRVTFVEHWESEAHWHRHMTSGYMQQFRATAGHCIGEFDLIEMHQIA